MLPQVTFSCFSFLSFALSLCLHVRICHGTVARGNEMDSSADAKPEAWSAVQQKNLYSQRLLATENSDYY